MPGRDKARVSFRISASAKRQVEQLTQVMRLSQTAVLETAIRRLAKEENVAEAPALSPALMRLPLKERRKALAAAANFLAPANNEDLAKFTADRELTALTALDGVALVVEYEVLSCES